MLATHLVHGDRRILQHLMRCSKWPAPIYRLSSTQYRVRRQLWRVLDDQAAEGNAATEKEKDNG